MALSFLFRQNAELCIKMAATAKSLEMREEWIALARQWQQKAEAEQLSEPSSPDAETVGSPNLAPAEMPFEDEIRKKPSTLAPPMLDEPCEMNAAQPPSETADL